MANTGRVRKFAISIDPDEVVDFEEGLGYYEAIFEEMMFDKVGTYRFRYKDEECTITIDLQAATDGFEIWAAVQASDAHEHRLKEIAEAFDAYVVSSYSKSQSSPVI